MGLPDDVDLMIEAKGSSDLSFLPHVSRLLLPDLSCLSVYLLTASHFFPFLNRIDKEQAVLHLYNVYDLFPVHRGSYVPPKPPAEPSATTDEDDPEAPLPRDKDGNPIELTPMAKAKRAKAKAKVVAGRKREAREEKKRLEAVADGEVLEEERVDADKIAPVKKGKGKGKGNGWRRGGRAARAEEAEHACQTSQGRAGRRGGCEEAGRQETSSDEEGRCYSREGEGSGGSCFWFRGWCGFGLVGDGRVVLGKGSRPIYQKLYPFSSLTYIMYCCLYLH
jgi:hypothetical protein